MRYGIIFWGGSKESIKILHIQKKAIRLITGLKKRESCKQKFTENRILTVTSPYVLEVLCFIKKYCKGGRTLERRAATIRVVNCKMFMFSVSDYTCSAGSHSKLPVGQCGI